MGERSLFYLLRNRFILNIEYACISYHFREDFNVLIIIIIIIINIIIKIIIIIIINIIIFLFLFFFNSYLQVHQYRKKYK